MRKKHDDTRGFTLIEVTLAILLLSGAMVVLLGLQSAVMRRTYVDSQNQRAMMAARQILSAIEASYLSVDIQETSGTVGDVLSEVIEINAEDKKSLKNFEDLTAHLTVTYWGIPNVDEQAMKRAEVILSWSDAPKDALSVVYFFPNDEEEASGAGGGSTNSNEEDEE